MTRVRSYHIPDAEGWRGGNTTRGSRRKGYRGGRVPVYPVGTVRHAISLTISEEHYKTADTLGRGNISKGVRLALTWARAELKTRAESASKVKAGRLEGKHEWDDV